MSDLHQILPLWRELSSSGQDYVLATVVQVDGSGYRKPGARMIVTADGQHVGTISGGCLEAEVARKAFWYTQSGPVLRQYSTHPDDGDVPYGMGCGGIIHVFLERSVTANAVMEQIAHRFNSREPLAIATILDGDNTSQRAFWPDDTIEQDWNTGVANLAYESFLNRHTFCTNIENEGQTVRVFVEWLPARTGLFVFGAGDDAIPLVKFACQMGWFITVLDGRAHLATRVRFPEAHEVYAPTPDILSSLTTRPGDTAALLTHSLEQDTCALSFALDQNLAYIGVLGPRRRTEQILATLAAERSGSASIEDRVAFWMHRLHAPMGLDLGGNTPADIALAAIAEIQQCLSHTTGKSLSELRSNAQAARMEASA
ncbi:XdhC family protein [Acidicapsa dinghuensis]|uniref:XdhC family protein n=1 Tax=Acidicapsa dinghuensis TaxID=2218256 RepID=A0ABW1EME7_9BACT|nr:XdhC/CoxI family protein [Acidicapsa dinghuensis]